MTKRVMRPMSITGILDEAFDLYKRHFVLLVSISLLIEMPVAVFFYASKRDAASWAIPLIILYLLDTVVLSWAISRCYFGHKVSILNVYKNVLTRLVPVIITLVIAMFMVFGGFFLLLVPGIVLMFTFYLISPIVALEGKYFINAIRRCWYLSKGQKMRIFLLLLIYIAVSLTFNQIILYPVRLIAGVGFFKEVTTGGLLGMLYGFSVGLSAALTAPFETITAILLYFDIRVRKEGYDLELLAQDLAASHSAAD